MTLEERFEKECETNDGLARKIEKLQGEFNADFGNPLRHSQSLRHPPLLAELRRQKKESDERLASLRQQTGAAGHLPSAQGKWYDTDLDTLRRRQIVLKNPNMSSKSLCKVFDQATPPIPQPRDWQAELGANTWSEAYKNQTGRKRIQKIISTDRRAG